MAIVHRNRPFITPSAAPASCRRCEFIRNPNRAV